MIGNQEHTRKNPAPFFQYDESGDAKSPFPPGGPLEPGDHLLGKFLEDFLAGVLSAKLPAKLLPHGNVAPLRPPAAILVVCKGTGYGWEKTGQTRFNRWEDRL